MTAKRQDVFHRCEYDAMIGENAPKHKTYVIRNYGAGDDAIDAAQTDLTDYFSKFGYRIVEHRDDGVYLPHTIEVFKKLPDGSEKRVVKLYNFKPDAATYTSDELIKAPHLLPNADVDAFLSAYNIKSAQ